MNTLHSVEEVIQYTLELALYFLRLKLPSAEISSIPDVSTIKMAHQLNHVDQNT
jgi:hypothetical protein